MEKGNANRYALAKVTPQGDSPLKGKRFYWLGSSVTAGLFSYGEAVPEFLDALYECQSLKDAVSGMILREKAPHDDSYLWRLKEGKILKPHSPIDALICQLFTNDAWDESLFGKITPKDCFDETAFDPKTTLGAIESICAFVKKNWDCPLFFYTGSFYCDFNGPAYQELVRSLYQLQEKWGFRIIDLFNDTAFNQSLPLPRNVLMHDGIHPFRAGYQLWWTPNFAKALSQKS
jgi:hypothetical protein